MKQNLLVLRGENDKEMETKLLRSNFQLISLILFFLLFLGNFCHELFCGGGRNLRLETQRTVKQLELDALIVH